MSSAWGHSLDWGWPWSPPGASPCLLYPKSNLYTSSASSLWMLWGCWWAGEMFCGPLRGMASVGTRKILFTATSFAQAEDLGGRLDSSRMWRSQICQIVITVRYNFLPLPLPLYQAHGVHLFMETVWFWLGIFRQSLCWAGVTSHQSSTCQYHPASLL